MRAVPTAPTAAPEVPSPWLFSAPLDLLIGCGAWSLPLLALTYFLQRENGAAVAFAFYLLAVFCNHPHYMATIHRAYHTATDFNQYRFFTVYVTVLLALTVVLVHFVPALFPWVVTLYLTWSPWHYTGQNFGIALLLARRAGVPPDPLARQLLSASYALSYGVWFLTLHTARDATDPYFLSLGIPSAVAGPLQLAFTLAFVATAGGAYVRLARGGHLGALAGPATLTLTQLLWFVAPALLSARGGLDLPASYFSAGALAFMHCAQYLWITSYYARRDTPHGAPPFRFERYYAILIVGGLALFIPGPWIASRLLGHDFVESFMIFMALVNLHHFILDGAVWKLRDGRIARLLVGRAPPAADPVDSALAAPEFSSHLGWLFGPAPTAGVVRIALALLVLALGALDQWQYFATSRTATGPALDRAEALNPADPRPAFRRAQQLEAAGDFPAARREIEDLLRLHPRNVPAQYLLGRVLFALGDSAAAIAHYDRLFDLHPADASVALDRGLAAAAVGDRAKALAGFERAVRLAPGRIQAQACLAAELTRQGPPIRALAAYDAFFQLFAANEYSYPVEAYLDLAVDYGATLLSQPAPDPAALAAAEPRLQHAADIAASQKLFPSASALLRRLAAIQEKLHHPADAANNLALAKQVDQLILPTVARPQSPP